jgi:hypothetical protein
MDYRQPIEPAVIVLAVAGVLSLRHAEIRKPVAVVSPVTAD